MIYCLPHYFVLVKNLETAWVGLLLHVVYNLH